MFDAWEDAGFAPTKLHENNKKNKMLESLGITNKRKITQKLEKNDEKSLKLQSINELQANGVKMNNKNTCINKTSR